MPAPLIDRVDEVDSTQLACKRLARSGAPEGTAVTARHQRQGRGRSGRQWWDAPGQSLLMSVLLRPPVPPGRAVQIPLIAGLAVSDALASAASISARLRWPNDVLVDDRKLCGILTEAASGPNGELDHVIVGIGINLDQTAFPEELRDRATSVRIATGRFVDHESVLQAVLTALDTRYREWLALGFPPLGEAWGARSCTLGMPIVVHGGARGTAVDIDEDGALVVAGADGRRFRVVSGEVATPEPERQSTGTRCCS